MSGALEQLRQDVVQALNRGGVAAVAAMEPQGRKRWDGPVAAVGLVGQDSKVLSAVLKWAILMLVLACILVGCFQWLAPYLIG